MSMKRLLGFVFLIAGIVAVGYAVYAKGLIASAKKAVGAATKPFSENPIGKTVGGTLEKKASQYDTVVQVLLIGGIVLVVVGGAIVFFGKKKKR